MRTRDKGLSRSVRRADARARLTPVLMTGLLAGVAFFLVRSGTEYWRHRDYEAVARWIRSEADGKPVVLAVVQPKDCVNSEGPVQRLLSELAEEHDAWVAVLVLANRVPRASVDAILASRAIPFPTMVARSSVFDVSLMRAGFSQTPLFVVVDVQGRIRHLEPSDPDRPWTTLKALSAALKRIDSASES